MKKILCATDGSDHSVLAIELAAGLAQKFDASLTICTVNIVRGRTGGPFISAWDDDEVKKILGAATASAEKAGVGNVELIKLRGREAAAAVVRFAEESGFDHIVVGTGDRHGVSRLVLGSVAVDISGRASCSVTIAR